MSTKLVTGASGAIGSHLAKELLKRGHHVVSIKHDERPFDTSSLLGIRDKISWVRGSVLDLELCKRLVADFAVDTIYHLAALPLVQVGTRTTTPVFNTNIMGTVNLLEAVKENSWAGKDIKFIYVSTDKAYGSAGNIPYVETMPLEGLAVYDCSKSCADLIARCYARSNLAPSLAVVRPCNIIAPGDLNLGRVLPRTIIPSIRNEPPVLYRTSYLREFMYVFDAVRGMIAVADGLTTHHDDVHGQAYNIGSGEQKTLEQSVDAVLKHFPGIEPKWVEPPHLSRVEIPFQKLDITKIKDTLGWEPMVSFEETVTRLVKWWRDNWESIPDSVRNWRTEGWHE